MWALLYFFPNKMTLTERVRTIYLFSISKEVIIKKLVIFLHLESLRIFYRICLKYSKCDFEKRNQLSREIVLLKYLSARYTACNPIHLEFVLVSMWNMVTRFGELHCLLPEALFITFEKLKIITLLWFNFHSLTCFCQVYTYLFNSALSNSMLHASSRATMRPFRFSRVMIH